MENPRLVDKNNFLSVTEVIQSHVDTVEFGPSSVQVAGWIFHPTIPIQRISVLIGNRVLATDVPFTDRPDVQECFKDAPFRSDNTLRSGFKFQAPADFQPADPYNVLVTILPFTAEGPLRAVYILYCNVPYDEASRPQPPSHLKMRIGGEVNYTQTGLATLSLILTHVATFRSLAGFGRVLDWGCGAGRVARHLAKCIDPADVHGCDIDPEAIRWAQENLAPSRFTAIPTHPPTAYECAFFDVVYGISVMTHLDEPTQLQWLAELRRITRPGAILLLSVISGPMREASMPAHLRSEFDSKGFAAYVPDYEQSFREFSEEGYYKEAYHSIDYIQRVWGKFFTIEEHAKCLISTGQDLILLRRTAD